jgi:SAM-dependent methyltransferase
MSSAKHYDTFARYYDEVVGPRDDVALYLHRLIQRYAPEAHSVLELGCGSGSMLARLSKHYKAAGIDSSRAMLSIARRKAPRAVLTLGDITNFDLKRRFDVVLCPFDTINHVTSFAGWKKIFYNARKHLNPNGVFIFDVNTEHKMESYRLDPINAEISRETISIVHVSRATRYRYTVHLKLLKKASGKNYTLHEMNLPELIVPTPRITRELSRFFSRVTLIDPDRRRPTENTEELYFVCS